MTTRFVAYVDVYPPVQGEQQMVEAEDADVPERGLQAPAHRADT